MTIPDNVSHIPLNICITPFQALSHAPVKTPVTKLIIPLKIFLIPSNTLLTVFFIPPNIDENKLPKLRSVLPSTLHTPFQIFLITLEIPFITDLTVLDIPFHTVLITFHIAFKTVLIVFNIAFQTVLKKFPIVSNIGFKKFHIVSQTDLIVFHIPSSADLIVFHIDWNIDDIKFQTSSRPDLIKSHTILIKSLNIPNMCEGILPNHINKLVTTPTNPSHISPIPDNILSPSKVKIPIIISITPFTTSIIFPATAIIVATISYTTPIIPFNTELTTGARTFIKRFTSGAIALSHIIPITSTTLPIHVITF